MRAKAEGVRSACSLRLARLLASCSEFAGAGNARVASCRAATRRKVSQEKMEMRKRKRRRRSTTALSLTRCIPSHWPPCVLRLRPLHEQRGCRRIALRAQASANVMRLLDAEVESAQARKATHELRRKAAALAHHVTSMRRPNLGKSSDTHKVLPLLLRWCEALDATARSSFLRALRHATAELRAVKYAGTVSCSRTRYAR